MTGIGVVHLVLLGFAVLVAAPSLVVSAQIFLAARARSGERASPVASARPRLAVLMPAHDEAAGIAGPIAAVLSQLGARDALLVVADNCSDDTALVARRSGARVVERNDAQRRGKGYALDFGLRALESDPPEVVVVVDADCLVADGSLDRLSRAAVAFNRPAQALYVMRAPNDATPGARLAAFAWIVRNHVRPLGWARIGAPCQLMGSGMAFPWSVLRRASLASGDLTEDLLLGLELAEAGFAPRYCPQALVTSEFPQRADAAAAQRTRWEHGHLALLFRMGPRLLWRGLRSANLGLVAMALDLCVPPLVALVFVTGLCVIAGLALGLAGGLWASAVVSTFAGALLAVALATAWWRHGRSIVSPDDLRQLPAYLGSKLPIYRKFLRGRQVEWVRTERGNGRR